MTAVAGDIEDYEDFAGDHIRPLTAGEYVGEVHRVRCPLCWAEPGAECDLNVPEDIVFIVLGRISGGQVWSWYHDLRRLRAEWKIGL